MLKLKKYQVLFVYLVYYLYHSFSAIIYAIVYGGGVGLLAKLKGSHKSKLLAAGGGSWFGLTYLVMAALLNSLPEVWSAAVLIV